MKRVLLAVGLVLAFASSCLAFPMSGLFDPASILSSVIEQEAKESAVSPAFLSLVKVFNELHEKQIDEKQAKEFWKGNYRSHHGALFDIYYDLGTVEDAVQCFNELRKARRADDDVKVGILKNNEGRSSAGYVMCSVEEFVEELEIGRVAFAHFDEEQMEAQKGVAGEMLSSLILPTFGRGAYHSAQDAAYAQTDVGVAVLGLKGDKALVWTPEGGKEMDLKALLDASDYILVFESEKLKERQREEQKKSESEAYLEKIRQEVKE